MSSLPNFVDLLNSQQDCILSDPFQYSSPSVFADNEQTEEVTPEARGRNKWSVDDDLVLISAWLNTSKDPLVSNEQKSGAFWKRIAEYVSGSGRAGVRTVSHCKNRWSKIHAQVSKFCGAFDYATRQRSSGQNDDDVLQAAHEFYKSDHGQKFTLEHAWLELRHDQKWCDFAGSGSNVSSKRRRCNEASQPDSPQDDETNMRPPGVKAAKGSKSSKRGARQAAPGGVSFAHFQDMWTMKAQDNADRKKLTSSRLLASLMNKKATLSEKEQALKEKLLDELLST